MPDDTYPDGERQLFVWEAMTPVLGRQRIVGFSNGLVDGGLKPHTVQGYLGYLRRLVQYVLEFPYIPGTEVQSIISKYGRLEQPVLEYDYPVHVLDQEEEGFVLTGEQLLRFYDFVRLEYIGHNQKKLPASRDYTMIVVAGESGLRADEIRHLDALGPHRDLFYEHNCIQTRHGKGTKGSGKRVRKTIFVEAARKVGLEVPPKLSWHSLRKSFATNFMEQHPDRPWVLMDLLGHLNPSTLQRYVKHSRTYYEQAIDEIMGAMVIDTTQMQGVV